MRVMHRRVCAVSIASRRKECHGKKSERACAAWGETAPRLELSGWLDDRRL